MFRSEIIYFWKRATFNQQQKCKYPKSPLWNCFIFKLCIAKQTINFAYERPWHFFRWWIEKLIVSGLYLLKKNFIIWLIICKTTRYTYSMCFFSWEQKVKNSGEFSPNHRRFSRTLEILFPLKKYIQHVTFLSFFFFNLH